jgi:Zn-finger nucleic acid-binding protein
MFRTRATVCPNCHQALDERDLSPQRASVRFLGWSCPRCDGHFVPLQTLHELFAAFGSVNELMEHQNEEAHHRCPLCQLLMRRVWLDFLFFERCDEHGYWFDAGKLALALRHVGEGPLVTAKDLAALAPKPKSGG